MLENKDQVKEIFKQGYRFRNTAAVIGNLYDDNEDLYKGPFIVNAAFSLELYLKCIYLIENPNQKIPHFHNLDDIFYALSKDAQDYSIRIFSATNRGLSSYQALKHFTIDFDWTLQSVLKRASKAFVKWRYSYEYDESDLPDFLSVTAIITALEATILLLRKDLKEVASKMHQ